MKIREMANSFFKWEPYSFPYGAFLIRCPGLWANKIALLEPPRIYFACGFRKGNWQPDINNERLVAHKKEGRGFRPALRRSDVSCHCVCWPARESHR